MIYYIVFYQVYFVKDKEVPEHTEDMATSSGIFEEEYHNGKRCVSYIRLCIYDVHTEERGEGGGLGYCHVFTDSTVFKQYFCSLLQMEGCRTTKVVSFCRHHKCITPIFKTSKK